MLPLAEAKGMVRMVGAIFQRGLASSQPDLLTHPPGWMTDELLSRYRTIYEIQQQSGMTLAELGVRYEANASEAAAAAMLAASVHYPIRGAVTFKGAVGVNVASGGRSTKK